MRLNVEQYRKILDEKQLSDEYVQKATGLSKKTYLWILERCSIECETLVRIADAIGCPVSEILKDDYEGYAENVIEWVKDLKIATLSLSQRRTISRVKRLAKKYPEECKILKENKDGSLYAHIPTAWIKIAKPKTVSEEQRKKFKDRMHGNSRKSLVTKENQYQISTKTL